MCSPMPSLITEHLVADRRRQLLDDARAHRLAKDARDVLESCSVTETRSASGLRRVAARLLPRSA